MGTRGVIGILTGGGDVPGLNPAIRAVTIRALGEGYRVLGIRRGWAGLVNLARDPGADNGEWVQVLTEEEVNRAGRTGGTFLHSSRTNPMAVKRDAVPVPEAVGHVPDVDVVAQRVIGDEDPVAEDERQPDRPGDARRRQRGVARVLPNRCERAAGRPRRLASVSL